MNLIDIIEKTIDIQVFIARSCNNIIQQNYVFNLH